MKNIIYALALALFIISTVKAQNNNKYMLDKVYKLEFSNKVKIKIGNAIKILDSNKWKKGGKVDNHTIKPELFNKLQNKTTKKIRIQIIKKAKIGTIHKLILTDLKTGKIINGIFDKRTNKFAVSSIKGKKQKKLHKNKILIFKGKFNTKKTKIFNGKFENSIIVNNKKAFLTIKATFNFKATKI